MGFQKECICTPYREYIGKGELNLENEEIESYFKLIARHDGKREFDCYFYVDDSNVNGLKTVINSFNSGEVMYCSFSGEDYKNGKVIIDRIALDNAYFDKTDFSLLLSKKKFMDFLNSGQDSLGKPLVHLGFLILSDVNIIYEDIETDIYLEYKCCLTNFYYGPLEDSLLKSYPILDEFKATISGYELEFYKAVEYFDIINTLQRNKNVDVTSSVRTKLRMAKLSEIKEIIANVCVLLSYATSNWVTPIIGDVISDGKIRRTILFGAKTYSYIKAQNSIDTRDVQMNNLGQFLQIGYPLLKDLIKNFSIEKAIEYYISAQATSIMQERFILAYTAFEILANKGIDYAKELGEVIVPGAIEEMRNKLEECFRRLAVTISNDDLNFLGECCAYKQISIKDGQKYILNKFMIAYDADILNELYAIRNKLFHGGDYSNANEYHNLTLKTTQLFEVLDKIILTMLEWRGHEYVSKVKGYEIITL